MKLLLTGVAGTGKSTIIRSLIDRGVTAIDLHDVPGMFFWQDKKTKERVPYSPVHSREWFDTVDRLCDIEKLQELLQEHDHVVMAGTANGNQEAYLPLFDKVVLLQCEPETLVHRMQTRTNKSGFGKTQAEQEDNIEWQKEFDPYLLSKGAIPVNTGRDLDRVTDDIINML